MATRAARPSWSGSITFAGFPIHLSVFTLSGSRSSDSFKTLDQDGEPVKQILVDHNGQEIDREDTQKGFATAKDTYVILPPDALEAIKDADSTKNLEIDRFCPLDSVPLYLSRAAYRVVPDPKIPGSEGPAGILWNGLKDSGRALVTEWVPRSGARDDILVIHADEYGINANALPYFEELRDVPEAMYEPNPQAAEMFEQLVTAQYRTDAWAHTAYTSSYAERRKAAIEAAIAGEPIVVSEVVAPKAVATPDLMAAMAAQLGATAPKPAAAKKPRAKVKAES